LDLRGRKRKNERMKEKRRRKELWETVEEQQLLEDEVREW
jgi:hypothetical protein